jgi:hypothetical protein
MHTGRVMGGGLAAFVIVPYYLWQLGPGAIFGFTPYLVAAACVGFFVVLVHRILRPPRAELDKTFIEVTPGGIWRVTPTSRSILLSAPQIQRVRVFRSSFNQIVRLVIGSGTVSATFAGLDDMKVFLDDVLSTFKICVVASEEGR